MALFAISVLIIGIGICIYQGHNEQNSINLEDKLSFMTITRKEQLRINQIRDTPAWFRVQVISLYVNRIYAGISGFRGHSFEEEVNDRLELEFVDLNEDSIPEVFINYSGIDLCGNHDCPTDMYSISLKTKKLIHIGNVTANVHSILDDGDFMVYYYNDYRAISNCKYGVGDIHLLLYSKENMKYESETIYGTKSSFGNGCKFVGDDKLSKSRRIFKKYIDNNM